MWCQAPSHTIAGETSGEIVYSDGAGDIEGHAAAPARVQAVGAAVAVERALGQHVAPAPGRAASGAPTRRPRAAGARARRCRGPSRRTSRRSRGRRRRRGRGSSRDRRASGSAGAPSSPLLAWPLASPATWPMPSSSVHWARRFGAAEAGAAHHPRTPSTAMNAASLRIRANASPTRAGGAYPFGIGMLCRTATNVPAARFSSPAALRVAGRLSGVALLLVRRVRGVGRGTAVARLGRRPADVPGWLSSAFWSLVSGLAGVVGGDGVVALFGHARRRTRSGGADRRASVGQQRHRQTLVAAEEHGARDGRRAEAVAHAVERRVERAAALEGGARAGPSAASSRLVEGDAERA